MDRLGQRIAVTQKALGWLKKSAGARNPSTEKRDAAIKRFGYTVEAMWK